MPDSFLLAAVFLLDRIAQVRHGVRQFQQGLRLFIVQLVVLHREQDILPHQIFPSLIQDFLGRESQQFFPKGILLLRQLIIELLVQSAVLLLLDYRETVLERHKAQSSAIVPLHEQGRLVIDANHTPAQDKSFPVLLRSKRRPPRGRGKLGNLPAGQY